MKYKNSPYFKGALVGDDLLIVAKSSVTMSEAGFARDDETLENRPPTYTD